MKKILCLLLLLLFIAGCAGKKAEKMEWIFLNTNTEENLLSISFASNDNGWAVTDQGNLLYSSNGGEDWSVSKISDYKLTAVCAVDKKTVWAAGVNGTLYTSMEGSSSMQDRSLEKGVDFVDMAFWDEDNGILIGNRVDRDSNIIGVVYRTDNGGQEWSELYVDIGQITCLATLGESLGWIGTNGTVWTTKDFGANWDENYLGDNISVNAMFYDDYSTGFLVGDSGTYYISFDGGWSWDNLGGQFPKQSLNAVAFMDRFNGVIVGNGGVIMLTSNSGDSWGINSNATQVNLFDIAVYNKKMWICGAKGTLLMVK